MRKSGTKYPLYRACLHLYPKNYRREYGDQMVQTLEDMLAHSATRTERAAIWLRVAAETPVAILKETITSRGDIDMRKLTTISNKRLLAGGLVVTIIVLGIVWHFWRGAIMLRAAQVFYGGSVRQQAIVQNEAFADPFTQFTGTLPKTVTTCSSMSLDAIRLQIECDASLQASTKLGQSAADKTRIIAAAQATTKALKAAGYEDGDNGVTFESLVAGTYEGKDYSPDAFYHKTVGEYTCLFDTTVAYSNPSQPAISMHLNCFRVLAPLGGTPVTYRF